MFIRRIAASACALRLQSSRPPPSRCRPATRRPPSSQPAASSTATPSTTCRTSRTVSAPIGDTKSDLTPATRRPIQVDRAARADRAAHRRHGTTKPTTPAVAAVASHDDTTNGWQIAAWPRQPSSRPRAGRGRAVPQPPTRSALAVQRARRRGRGVRPRSLGTSSPDPHCSAPDIQGDRTMLTRRIVASACALCLAVPAAATANGRRVRRPRPPHSRRGRRHRRHQERPARPRPTSRPSPATPRADLPRAIAPAPATTKPVAPRRPAAPRPPSRATARPTAGRSPPSSRPA